MLESTIEGYLRDEIKKLGGKAFKWVSPGTRGVPDRIVVLPGGRIFFIELKAPGKKSTLLQTRVQDKLRQLGCIVLVIDSKDRVKDFIKSLCNE